MFKRIDVHPVLERGDGCPYRTGANLHQIRTSGQHGLVVHPDDNSLKLVRHTSWRVRARQNVAATDVDLVLHDEGHGLTSDASIKVSVQGDDARYTTLLARRQSFHPVAFCD